MKISWKHVGLFVTIKSVQGGLVGFLKRILNEVFQIIDFTKIRNDSKEPTFCQINFHKKYNICLIGHVSAYSHL